MTNLSTQYDHFADAFSASHAGGDDTSSNRASRTTFYTYLDFVRPGVKLLDVGCGDGLDLLHYRSLGAEVKGLDASK